MFLFIFVSTATEVCREVFEKTGIPPSQGNSSKTTLSDALLNPLYAGIENGHYEPFENDFD